MASGYINLPSFGLVSWRDPVASATNLPANGNRPGDAIAVIDTQIIYVWSGVSWTAPAGAGTVTSVGLAAPSIFTVSGSPVTGFGTLSLTLNNESANSVFAGPTSGGAAIPTFRALVAADIPALPYQPPGNYLTALTGDGTAAGPGSSALTLATVNANVGTFTKVTVNGKGLVTAATTLSAGDIPALAYVTSVGLSLPSIFTVSGSPVTSSGTLTGTLNTQAAHAAFIGPVSGAAATPTFRALAIADMPATSGSSFLTAGTTYTTPAAITAATRFKFTLVGGGGGGGGGPTAATTHHSCGGGGGGAGVVWLTGLTPSTAYTIAIGAGGAQGANTPTPGGAGGNTTLTVGATTYTAAGGGGGPDTISTTIGGAGGTVTNCTIAVIGQAGGGSGSASAAGVPGAGGNSGLGFGLGGVGTAVFVGNDGSNGTGYGGGGSGTTGTSGIGGAGAAGCILVEWST